MTCQTFIDKSSTKGSIFTTTKVLKTKLRPTSSWSTIFSVSLSNQKTSSIGFAEPRDADSFQLCGKSERPGKDMPAPRRKLLLDAGVAGAFEDSPTVELRKTMKSKCLSLKKVGKRGREEADTYATWLDGRVCESPDTINDSGFGGGAP